LPAVPHLGDAFLANIHPAANEVVVWPRGGLFPKLERRLQPKALLPVK
jgi:hypothetical protein